MTESYRFENLAEPVAVDPIGTVRVSTEFGCVAVYIKIGENRWRTTYVSASNDIDFVPVYSTLSDKVAGLHPVVFSPKVVV
jgi:hypothetical protein